MTTAAAPVSTKNVAEPQARHRVYRKPDGTVMVEALRGIDLDIPRGQYIAIMGASGSGKSTLMNILGCLDRPSEGSYTVDGEDTRTMPDEQLSVFRGRKIGFVFQAFNLIPQLTIEENVATPLFYQGVPKHDRIKRAIRVACGVVGGDRSGSSSERAFGRAATAIGDREGTRDQSGHPDGGRADRKPRFDHGPGDSQALRESALGGMTLIMVTHDDSIAKRCERVVRLKDGLIEYDRMVENRIRD
ncbi:MAG: ABC transporter ATP-binding protein [Phycisphaeraceae bacterium]|nr:ABC transporter ATP-binding protein [Phycisphaeraceae bacterium]